MRIDKYLKVARLIKRRTVANDACGAERVTVNGRTVKPSYDVKPGDLIEIAFGGRTLRVRVTEIRDSTKKADAGAMYEVIEGENPGWEFSRRIPHSLWYKRISGSKR